MPSFFRQARFPTALLLATLAAAPLKADDHFNVAEARKSVVFVRRVTPGRETALGSGFLVSDDGLIYTSRHVIQPRDPTARGTFILVGVPSASDPDDLDWFQALVAAEPADGENLDFALLKIAARADYGPFHVLPLSYEKLELGASVAVIGYPYIRENQAVLSFNKGSISSTRVRFGGRPYYQTDAAVNHGNSGGPLLNVKGEAVGIVTLKEIDAENIGFALYLSETKVLAQIDAPRLAALRPERGPVDPSKLRLPVGIAPRVEAWESVEGRTNGEEEGRLVIDNHGGPYWLTSRQELPKKFQLVVPAGIEYLQGSQKVDSSKRPSLRNLYVRFGTASDAAATERHGYLVRFSHNGLVLWREGKVVKSLAKGNSQRAPFVLSITRLGADIEIAVDGQRLLQFRDPEPLPTGGKVSVGGSLSRLHLGEVTVIDLTDEPAE